MKTAMNGSGVGSKRVALPDIWNYSFVTSEWKETKELGNFSSSAFGAAANFLSSDGLHVSLAHGGVSEEYVPGVSGSLKFDSQASNPFPHGPGRRQPTAEMKALLPTSWIPSPEFNRWIRVKPKNWNINCLSLQPLCNEQGDDYWKCMPAPYPWWISLGQPPFGVRPCTWAAPTVEGKCGKLSDPETQLCTVQLPPSMTCEPAGRFMHSLTASAFKSGKSSAVLYGGIDMYGRLLADTWLYDLTTFPDSKCTGCGFLFRMALNVNVSSLACQPTYLADYQGIVAKMFSQTAESVHVEIVEVPSTYTPEKKICEWKCNTDADDTWQLQLPEGLRNKKEGERIKLIVSITEPVSLFGRIGKCSAGCNNLFKEAMVGTLLEDSAMESVQTLTTDQTIEACYKANKDYNDFLRNCLRHKEARIDMMQLDSGFTCQKSCSQGVCQFKDIAMYEDDPPRCFKEGPCGTDGVCSLPGRRSGHAATSFNFNGGPSVLLVYGGEIYQSEASSERMLTGDVVTGWFEGSSVTWSRLSLDCPETFSCPESRRDSSVSIIDMGGGSSGKLIVFGGFSGATVDDYLEGSSSNIYSLNDLWYLDLVQLNNVGNEDCLTIGKCLSPMKWVKIEVPGDMPLSRFGAGMSVLDSDGKGVLYLTGGINKIDGPRTSQPTQELDDLFLFQLRDPYYRRCAATGKGLVSAIAGQYTPFYIACTNLLGAPAIGAQFHVSVLPGASCSGCPSSYPPVSTVAVGLYVCSFTPTVAGEYEIFIKVGRGGSKYQEPVGGDPIGVASVDDATIRQQISGSNRTFFELLVLAAPTNQRSSIASGQGLTLSTSGVSAGFVIAAVDSFMNRRPGGEDISVIMQNTESIDLPLAAKVEDNSDGTYTVSYTITVSSNYAM